MKKLQGRNTVNDDLLHQRIATFNRESLPSEKVVRQTTEDIERRFSDKMRQQYKESREIAKSVNKGYAPLVQIFSKDQQAVEAKRKLRQTLSRRTKSPLPALTIPAARSMIASGSIFTVVAPPYDSAWQWFDPNNTGVAAAQADKFSGNFGGMAQSNEGPSPEGYGQAGAGIGIAFHPIAEELLSVNYQLSYNVSWYEDSQWDTAHTSGFSHLVVYQYDLNWAFQKLSASASTLIWSDGTSWLETHSGGTAVTETLTPSIFNMFMSPNNNYMLWFFGTWEADGAGDPNGLASSSAQCWVQANLPYVVLEQSF